MFRKMNIASHSLNINAKHTCKKRFSTVFII